MYARRGYRRLAKTSAREHACDRGTKERLADDPRLRQTGGDLVPTNGARAAPGLDLVARPKLGDDATTAHQVFQFNALNAGYTILFALAHQRSIVRLDEQFQGLIDRRALFHFLRRTASCVVHVRHGVQYRCSGAWS
eukprot:CAMPEP_0182557754 /NCGR_PEP_ID=MMETSP1324-20130603/1558_1 /TAXON_ID=236786 /ORGANISM="Florenciella sp., Strain RCC1587" /LENGTH=136 /DNA_ID=CAMNT_0024769857 /DNA_START=84 /DNA_END=494 /DNA_ORIENTATION=-